MSRVVEAGVPTQTVHVATTGRRQLQLLAAGGPVSKPAVADGVQARNEIHPAADDVERRIWRGMIRRHGLASIRRRAHELAPRIRALVEAAPGARSSRGAW